MDCVTQSASPLGHNLKNDTRKTFLLNFSFLNANRHVPKYMPARKGLDKEMGMSGTGTWYPVESKSKHADD